MISEIITAPHGGGWPELQSQSVGVPSFSSFSFSNMKRGFAAFKHLFFRLSGGEVELCKDV